MSREQLELLLTRLREELAALERAGTQISAQDEGVTGELKRRVETFEVEHPRVTAILNDMMVTLSNLGI